MKPMLLLFVSVCIVLPVRGVRAQSWDLAWHGHGLSVGNSKRITGIRINAVDRDVEAVNGLNLSLWNPSKNPRATYNGLALGVIGTKAQRIHGVALSGVGVNASGHVRGIAAGVLGVGSNHVTGIAAGSITDIRVRVRGVALAGLWTGSCAQLDGAALALGAATAKNIRGLAVGGFGAAGEQSLTGVALSLGGFYAARFRGVGIGGVGGGSENLRGVALSLGGIGGGTLDGVAVAGLGLGARERIRGLSMGGVVAFAPEVTGVSIGALNGVYIDRIDLEDFLHFNLVNQRFTGLAIGIVNYTANLRGVQLGLLNYAGNNPRWLRLLPLINVHL